MSSDHHACLFSRAASDSISNTPVSTGLQRERDFHFYMLQGEACLEGRGSGQPPDAEGFLEQSATDPRAGSLRDAALLFSSESVTADSRPSHTTVTDEVLKWQMAPLFLELRTRNKITKKC